MSALNAGSVLESVPDNPSSGAPVVLSPFSGPTGSPQDALYYPDPDPSDISATPEVNTADHSTGALSTGIGFGANVGYAEKIGMATITPNFTDNYQPGITMPDGTSAAEAVLTAIGGGKSAPNTNTAGTVYMDGIAPADPYDAQPLLMMGNDQQRDSGTYSGTPVTGFGMKTVTATGTVAAGAAIEAGWLNRAGGSILTGQSEFGVSTTPSPAVT